MLHAWLLAPPPTNPYIPPCPQSKLPHVLSLTDFIGWRYGWVAKTYVVLLCCFNMSIGACTHCLPLPCCASRWLLGASAPLLAAEPS